MSRLIVIFLAASVIGYFGWRAWNENNKPQKVVVAVPKVEEKTEVKPVVKSQPAAHANLKDKKLHQAFAKILAKEKKPKKKKRTIDELIQYNLETGSVEMTDEERSLVIEKLQKDVSSFGGVITSLYAADQTEKAEEFETKLEQKREQLENFRQLHRKIAGVKSEN